MTTQILEGDCLDVMKEFPDNCINLCFCSPPYEDARTYGIDFKLKGQDWVDWMIPRIEEMVRITNGLVAIVVNGKTRKFQWSATPILLMADLHRKGICLRKPPAFHRVGIPGSGGPDWIRDDYEFIVCCTSGGKLPWSDNTAMGHPPKCPPGGNPSHRIPDGHRYNYDATHEARKDGSRKKPRYKPPVKANPGNVINLGAVGGGNMGSKLCHENEAPFPEKLAEFFIRSFCPPRGIVLDCFSGSGTTNAVAERLGRDSIAIEIRQSQIDLIKKRLEEQKGRKDVSTRSQ